MRGREREVLDQRRKRYEVFPGGDVAQPLDPDALFPSVRELWLEVGFGGGEHLVAQAVANPAVGLIGCEHYIDGVAGCLAKLETGEISNARVHHGDARDLMDALPDASVAKAFLLYPDPWPKARHHKRRFINPENLDSFARIMADGSHLRVASDIPEYIEWTKEHLLQRPDFALVSASDTAWHDWPGTRYEAKAFREGRTPAYLTYQRCGR